MNIKYILYCFSLLYVFSYTISVGQNSNMGVRIDSIRIEGNEITKDFVVLRELNFAIGDTVNESILNYNRERVFSLGIFNRVDFNIVNTDGFNELIISVKESWYIYPVPFLNWRENTIAKSSYGVFLLYKNFRGRNETIQALASFGYDPSFRLFYINPLINRKLDLSLGFGIFHQTIKNKSLRAIQLNQSDFDYKSSGVSITLGKRFNTYNNLFTSLGFSYIDVPVYIPGFNASNSKIDRIPWLQFQYILDTRNLKQFSKTGFFGKFEFTHNGFGSNDINYNVFGFDIRQYHPILDDITFKWRVNYRHTFGKIIPLYDYSFLGAGQYIRGHITEDREGNNSLLGSVELSYPIIKEWHFGLKLPLLPKRLTTARIGLQFNIFGDTGSTYNNGERISINKFDSGWGFGLTILFLPYNAIRFEYAFNEQMKGEFNIGSGFAF